MTTTPQLFTAASLAATLKVTPQAVRKALRGIPPAERVRVNGGQIADAWNLQALPADMQQRLTQWQPPIPRRDIAPEDWEAARCLQRALAPALRRLHESMTAEDYELAAVADYRAEFGREVSPRHVRGLLAMVRQRDRGAEDWSRLEIYLPENLTRRPAPIAPVAPSTNLQALPAYVGSCANPAQLTELERRGLWAHACEEHERLIAEGWTEDAAGRAVRDCLATLPPLASMNRHALRMKFTRKLALWRQGERATKALRDKREDNGEPVILPQSDFDAVIACAGRQFRGQVAPAVRHLLATEKLSPPARQRYGHVMQTRGYTPEIFVERCAYRAWLYYMHRMDRLDEATGNIDRDWTVMPSLRVYSADDLTPCVYFYIEDGAGWFRLARGQLLVFEDYGSGMILGYSLQPDAQYNSLVIRSLCTHVFSKYGLPTGLYFENGQWRTSKLLKGSKAPSNAEVTSGLEALGIRFTHTKHPWSKPIEKSFDLLQTLMQSEPGYCGREEKYDLPPEMKRIKQLVDARKAHPAELGLHSYETWSQRIGELCAQFNATPQMGVRCGGLSPAEACESRLPKGDPNMTFTPQVRHLLAQHREPRRVKLSGIEFQFGRRVFRYRGAEIAHLVGQTVIAGFDPENPEMLSVEDPGTKLVHCVALAEAVNPAEKLLGSGEALAREHAHVNGQAAPMRAYFKALDCSFQLPQRTVVADALTFENGRRIEQGREKARDDDRLAARAGRLSAALNVTVTPENLRKVTPDEVQQFNDWLKGNP